MLDNDFKPFPAARGASLVEVVHMKQHKVTKIKKSKQGEGFEGLIDRAAEETNMARARVGGAKASSARRKAKRRKTAPATASSAAVVDVSMEATPFPISESLSTTTGTSDKVRFQC